jgi:chromate transporter
MVPIVDRELIKKRGWITMDELLDYYTIAQITPGIIAVNVSTFIGSKQKGWFGGVVATIGFILPGIILMTVISIFISNFAQLAVVKSIFAGVRAAVGALIVDTVIKLGKGLFKGKGRAQAAISIIITIAAFCLSAFFFVNPILLVLAAGCVGVLIHLPALLKKNERPPKDKTS